MSAYDVQTVGGRICQEYWIPAEQLEAFNDAIVGEIEQIAMYRTSDTEQGSSAPGRRVPDR